MLSGDLLIVLQQATCGEGACRLVLTQGKAPSCYKNAFLCHRGEAVLDDDEGRPSDETETTQYFLDSVINAANDSTQSTLGHRLLRKQPGQFAK